MLEQRKAALTALQEQQRQQQSELAEVRKQSQAARGRLSSLEALQHAALGQEKNVALDWLKANGIADNARLGESLQVEAGWETAVETVLGSLLEAVTVDAPRKWLDALGEPGAGPRGPGQRQRRSGGRAGRLRWRRRCRARRRSVACWPASTPWKARAEARAVRLGAGRSRSSPARANGWAPAGCACCAAARRSRARWAREREIQSLRAEIDALAKSEQALNEGLTSMRDKLLEAEQQREDAQRALYLAHRSVSELAGQLQGQQGRLESAQARVARIDGELATLRHHAGRIAGQRHAKRAAASSRPSARWATSKPSASAWTPSAAASASSATPPATPPAKRATPRTSWR